MRMSGWLEGSGRHLAFVCPSWLRKAVFVFLLVFPASLAFPGLARATCFTSIPGGLNFGAVNLSAGVDVDRVFTVQLSCSTAEAERNCISFNAGANADGVNRRMRAGADYLRYQLYSDNAFTVVWGSYPAGYFAGVQLDTTFSTSLPIYARIFAGQQGLPANTAFSDSVGNDFTSQNDPGTAGSCPTSSPGITSYSLQSVSATVTANCSVSATPMNFGSSGSLASAAVDAAAAVSVSCSNGTAYTVSLSAGFGSGATVAARKMAAGFNSITYSLYRDSGRTQVWGNTIGTDTVGGTGTGSAVSHTVYGRVPVQATPPPGSYSDTVVVTVTY